MAREPLARLRASLLAAGATEQRLAEIDAEVEAIVDAADEAVRAMPEPDPATATDHLVATPTTRAEISVATVREVELTYQKAVNAALRAELEARPELLVYGEDVGVAGGIFGVSRGLQEEFGADRVFDTPISESAILGSAVGAAMAGCGLSSRSCGATSCSWHSTSW